jgi:hypothetical protein
MKSSAAVEAADSRVGCTVVMSFSKRARAAQEPRPDRRSRRLLPTVMTSAAIAAGLPGAAQAAPTPELSLRATTSGYALVTAAGKVAYRAEGPRARELCLRRALRLGIVRLR